jgi:hypothetical protein
MPIVPSIPTRRISQDEFGALAYEVMSHVFAIHDDFGRLFDEAIYKKELAGRMHGVELEVPVEVVHDAFRKTYLRRRFGWSRSPWSWTRAFPFIPQ